jgi:homoserine kinase
MRVHVRVPATTANLGPGFDALGLALGLHNEVVLEEQDGVVVAVEGEGAGRLATGADNVVARGVRAAYEAAGKPFPGARLRCVNRIPPSRGLGSSAAAWVGGLAAGNAALGSPLDREALLALATRAEGHPDNVAAAIFGGLTVACASGERVAVVALPVPAELEWTVLVPDAEGSTAEARAVLPAALSRADAVFNIQRATLLLAALGAGRADLLGVAMEDRVHQPHRLPLFPWVAPAMTAARAAGALGCALSGAGPSLLAVTRGAGAAVGAAMVAAARGAGMTARAIALRADAEGTVVRVEGE